MAEVMFCTLSKKFFSEIFQKLIFVFVFNCLLFFDQQLISSCSFCSLLATSLKKSYSYRLMVMIDSELVVNLKFLLHNLQTFVIIFPITD